MTIVQINKYVVNYRTKDRKTLIKILYNLNETNVSEIIDVDEKDISFIVDLLRYEKPLFWSTSSKVLMTGPEEVGEEES